MKWQILMVGVALGLASQPAWAQICPGVGDEAQLSVVTTAGPTVFVCGFEDREVPATKPKRAFSEFTVYVTTRTAKTPEPIFSSDVADTYWIRPLGRQGLELEELWFFSDTPQAALRREVQCSASGCKVGTAKCVFKLAKNPFPESIKKLDAAMAAKIADEEIEELMDQVWAQAITGDVAAIKYYEVTPKGLPKPLTDAFEQNRKKLEELKALKCL